MQFIRYVHTPKVIVEFTEAECLVLMTASNRHYDKDCRSLSEAGGPLALLSKSIAERNGEPAKIRLSLSSLEILRHVLEPYNGSVLSPLVTPLRDFIAKTTKELNAEFDRVNIK